MRRRGKYYFRTCKICFRSFYTTSKHSSDKCRDHFKKGNTRIKTGFIGFWSKELRRDLRTKKISLDPKEDILKKMLGK